MLDSGILGIGIWGWGVFVRVVFVVVFGAEG